MRLRKASAIGGPSPQQLAAYVDGLLEGTPRARVEAWLDAHPEQCAELHGQRSLERLWETLPVPQPAAPAWDAVLTRIHAEATAQRRRPAARLRRWAARLILPLGGAAAVFLVAFWLHGPDSHGPADAFPVAGPEEVEIISLDDADRHLLAIGILPLSEPMVLVAPGDATEIEIQPDPGDGMMPTVLAQADGTTMIVAPLSAEGKD